MAFIERVGNTLEINPHQGQIDALNSQARVIAVISGSQGGKSSLGPVWLHQEIQKRGAGDYMVVTPTFPLLEMSALPKFREYFEDLLKLGRYIGSPSRRFVVSPDGERRIWGHTQSDKTTVRFGYAADPSSLEAVTLKGLWADECGQTEFKRASWEALYTRRLAVNQGRALLTTTPYSIDGWLKELCDKAEQGDHNIDLIRFDSTANPAFPAEMWTEAQANMPAWKFDLFFRGIFSRPAGQIYDCFIDALAPQGHLIKPAAIPESWARFCGLDFGGVNTAAIYAAEERHPHDDPDQAAKGLWGAPTGRWIAYREYHAGSRTAAEHAAALMIGEPRPPKSVGGAASESQWRSEFKAAGLAIERPPVHEVEVGIDRVYAAIKTGRLLVSTECKGLLAEIRSYSRKLDQNGLVTEEIADKSTYHHLDALRYLCSYLLQSPTRSTVSSGLTKPRGGWS